ncbi:hypotetical protein [Streptococcus agalactiae]|nr:hypotetical protein [Streptococcus agalactiae]
MLSSTTQIYSLVGVATIFSMSSAPPPPLIPLKSGSTSSAPSTVTSMTSISSADFNGIPNPLACSVVRFDVVTPMTCNPSSLTRRPISSTKKYAVEPVPKPTIIPFLTYFAAVTPASFFSSSIFSPFKLMLSNIFDKSIQNTISRHIIPFFK